jgi:hypothetical protein
MARARSRKRRPRGGAGGGRRQGGGRVPASDGAPRAHKDAAHIERPASAAHPPAVARGGGPRTGSSGAHRARSSPTTSTFGERPRAPWHPLPLSELLILAGAVATVIGMKRLGHGISGGAPSLLVGIAVVAIGTIEVTLREHRSGYRSHTALLALIPVLVLDSLVVLGVSAVTTPPRLLTVGLIALDVAVFALLFKVLRARFVEARHARALRGG